MSEQAVDPRLAAEWRTLAALGAIPPAFELIARSGPERASRAALIAEIDDVSLGVGQLRASIDEAAVARLATRRWTVRDVLVHLASWALETRVEAERLLHGQRFDEIIAFGADGPHAWNQREIDRRRGRTLDEVFDEIDREHERLIALVASLGDADLQREFDLPRTRGVPPRPWRLPLGSMIIVSCRHARLHLGRLRRIVDEQA